MEYDDYLLPPEDQLNKINEAYSKIKKLNITQKVNREAKILENELQLLVSACIRKFEWQNNSLIALKKKTNNINLIKSINNLINENNFHFEKFNILYEDILPQQTNALEEATKISHNNFILLINNEIYNNIDLVKLLMELKNYETQTKLQSVLTNLINNRLDFIKHTSSLIEEYFKPSQNSFSFFQKRF